MRLRMYGCGVTGQLLFMFLFQPKVTKLTIQVIIHVALQVKIPYNETIQFRKGKKIAQEVTL